jgi:elongation factor G
MVEAASMIHPSDIRNIVFVGHTGHGKTSLVDALLYTAKVVGRKGSPDDGTSWLDTDDEEKARKHTIDTHVAHVDWHGKRYNLIDAPGYPDFLGQTISALYNVENAAIVIDSRRGIEMTTRRMFDEAGQAGVARLIVLTKLDVDGVDFNQLIASIKECFGKYVVLTEIPCVEDGKITRVVELLHADEADTSGAIGDVQALRVDLIERIVETNDAMMAGYLEGKVPTVPELAHALELASDQGKIVPIFCTSARTEVGLVEFLHSIEEFGLSPADAHHRLAHHGLVDVELLPADQQPFVARAFKAVADKFGNMTYLRIYQGKAHPNMTVKNGRDQTSHRLGQLNLLQGKQSSKIDDAGPGEVIGVPKLDGVNIDDVLSTDGTYTLDKTPFPKPMFPLAIEAVDRNDDTKIMAALRKIAHEDPCFELHRDSQTLEMVMSGLSQLHLETIQHRVQSRDHLTIKTKEPKIPYKETISVPGEGMYRHKKQTGGHGQFAEVHIRLKPLDRGMGFEFVDSVVGGSIPRHFIPAVEKGIHEALKEGVIAGCEVVDVSCEVHFGKFHDVDSSEAAFKLAASHAFKEAFRTCRPLLLEPIVELTVTVPSEKMGEINGDLNTRRAHITGMETLPGGLQQVQAHVPLAEILRYQTELKSMTGGQGVYVMELSHYSAVPPNVQQQVTEKAAHARHPVAT